MPWSAGTRGLPCVVEKNAVNYDDRIQIPPALLNICRAESLAECCHSCNAYRADSLPSGVHCNMWTW